MGGMRHFAMKMMVLGVVAAGAAGGCGGDGANAACGVEPCGGDLVGAWDLSAVCADTESLRQMFRDAFLEGSMGACPQVSSGPVSLGISGPLSYTDDLNYAVNMTVTLDGSLAIPTSCLAGDSCADLSAALADNPLFTGCTGTTTCTCKMHLVQTDVESGTYTLSGTAASMVASDGSTSALSYCVKGDTMTMRDADPDPESWLDALVAERH
jgi:hypothetical protein